MDEAISPENVDEIKARRRQLNVVRSLDHQVIASGSLQSKLPKRFGIDELLDLGLVDHLLKHTTPWMKPAAGMTPT